MGGISRSAFGHGEAACPTVKCCHSEESGQRLSEEQAMGVGRGTQSLLSGLVALIYLTWASLLSFSGVIEERWSRSHLRSVWPGPFGRHPLSNSLWCKRGAGTPLGLPSPKAYCMRAAYPLTSGSSRGVARLPERAARKEAFRPCVGEALCAEERCSERRGPIEQTRSHPCDWSECLGRRREGEHFPPKGSEVMRCIVQATMMDLQRLAGLSQLGRLCRGNMLKWRALYRRSMLMM
jgi:hypothetical protein